MKARNLLLIGALLGTLNGCVIEQTRPIPKVQHEIRTSSYIDNVVYRDFSKIDFDSIPVQKVKIPVDLEYVLKHSILHKHRMRDKSKLRRIALEQASVLGYDIEKIKKLSIRDSIMLCADIVAGRLEYHEVDEKDGDFVTKHGFNLPIEEYLEIGLGECNKYAAAMVRIFNLLKETNPSLVNVHIGYKEWGGNWNWTKHDWNSIVFLTNDEITFTNIDPTLYDVYGELEGKHGKHVSSNNLERLAFFYRGINHFDKSFEVFEELLYETDDIRKKAGIFSHLAFNACQARDSQKMESVRERFSELGTERQLDDILYWSFVLENYQGNDKEADKYKQELFEKFPNCYWMECVNRYR